LFGRAGADRATRLSFFASLGKTGVSMADLDEEIRRLREIRPQVRGKMRTAVDHGIDRLEQFANEMDEKSLPEIPLAHVLTTNV
jgi:hypothetical protein